MFQMFQWLHPQSWNQNPFKALINLVPNKRLGLFLITLELSPNSPPRQIGIIAVVLRVCFSLFQLLGWGHVISSLSLPITPPRSFMDFMSHSLMKAVAHRNLPLSFRISPESCFAPFGYCFLCSLQFLLLTLSTMPHRSRKLFGTKVPHLGI